MMQSPLSFSFLPYRISFKYSTNSSTLHRKAHIRIGRVRLFRIFFLLSNSCTFIHFDSEYIYRNDTIFFQYIQHTILRKMVCNICSYLSILFCQRRCYCVPSCLIRKLAHNPKIRIVQVKQKRIYIDVAYRNAWRLIRDLDGA